MSIDYDRTVAFVRAHGGEFEQARLDALLEVGSLLSDDQQRRFLSGQRADGGWPPPWAPEYSSLDATCFRLAQGEGLGIGFFVPSFARAAEFLRARQRADGTWDEDEAVRELAPTWAKPGALGARLYLTANCGWWLANATLRRLVTTDEAPRRAGAYLERHLAAEGALPSFLHTHWLACGLWICLGREDLARRVLDHLAARLGDDVPAGALAWMLTTLAGLGIAPEHPIAHRAVALLVAQQRADGGWASEDGPDRDPYVTVEVLRGLLQWAAL